MTWTQRGQAWTSDRQAKQVAGPNPQAGHEFGADDPDAPHQKQLHEDVPRRAPRPGRPADQCACWVQRWWGGSGAGKAPASPWKAMSQPVLNDTLPTVVRGCCGDGYSAPAEFAVPRKPRNAPWAAKRRKRRLWYILQVKQMSSGTGTVPEGAAPWTRRPSTSKVPGKHLEPTLRQGCASHVLPCLTRLLILPSFIPCLCLVMKTITGLVRMQKGFGVWENTNAAT